MASADSPPRDTTNPSTEPYTYDELPLPSSFRVAEILPGEPTDKVVVRLHATTWHQRPRYDAISYNWGNVLDKVRIICDGKSIAVTRNLHTALVHFRQRDQSRVLWADGLCIDQGNTPERGLQVKQMKSIYEKAQQVLVWVGADNAQKQAETAVGSIYKISSFLSKELNLSLWHAADRVDTYQEVILRYRDKLPLPDAAGFDSETLLSSLVWFYSHRYFSRVWAIQEITANECCKVHVGHSSIDWNRVDLVASYLIMDKAFSDRNGFSASNCWHVATFAEMVSQPQRWLNTLYVASNYGCLDERDVVYGLRGLMSLEKGASLLDPNYSKSTEEVYRDCVEAALVNFNNTDVLCYVTGNETPSWIPRWDVCMLFRNPFRFGKPMPWTPSAASTADWSIDKAAGTLDISGVMIGEIEYAARYNQVWFADNTLNSETELKKLGSSWAEILCMLGDSRQSLPISQATLTSLALSLSFGLNQKITSPEQSELVRQFIAYLGLVFANTKDVLQKYIPSELLKESTASDRRTFGKPIWDFQYPDAGIFVTKDQAIGCVISPTKPGDVVFVPHGSTYPLVLRPQHSPDGKNAYAIRGFSYVDGAMFGERAGSEVSRITLC